MTYDIKKARRSLRAAGFLKEEIIAATRTTRTLSSGKMIKTEPLSLSVPYVKYMIKERARGYRLARKQGLGRNQYIEMIKEHIYSDLDMLNEVGEIDFWQLLRREEERWKAAYPEYESPGNKTKKRSTHDFVNKYAKGLENYEKYRGR